MAATGGAAPLIAAGVAGGVGLVRWLLLRPFVLALLVAPLAAQVAVFAVAGVGVHPRYFAVALPLAVLVGAEGVATLVNAGVRLLIPPEAWRRRVAAAALAAIVVVSAYPLVRYYAIPKQDYRGAIAVLEDLEAKGGRGVAVGITANAMNGYYGTHFLTAERLEDLLAIERAARRPIHLATTMERLLTLAEPALVDHIRREYRIERYLPGSVGDAGLRIYSRQRAVTTGGRQ